MDESLKKNLTEAQKIAIQSDDSPLVVRAGAGSGKTMVLVKRYLRLVLEEKFKPQEILAATFTEKAAAEMKERVAEQLNQRNRPELVAELNAAPICTIHSFCSRLIAPKAIELGIDPNYRILEQYEADLLKEECLAEVLSNWRRSFPDRIKQIVNNLHWSGDYGLRQGRIPASRGFSRQFLELVDAARSAGKVESAPFSSLDISSAAITELIENIKREIKAILAGKAGFPEKSIEKLVVAEKALDKYEDCRQNSTYKENLDLLKEVAGISLAVSKPIKPILKQVRDVLCPLLYDEFFSEIYESLRLVLNQLYHDFLAAYQKKKAGMGVLDFLDLEEFALKLLESDQKLKPVKVVLIDEAQDLNPVQWNILSKLGESTTMFAVGDAQQSIYGFRYADVSLFAKFAEGARAGHGREVQLKDNFRSRPSILDAVNAIFKSIWTDESVTPFLELKPTYPYPEGESYKVELLTATDENRQKARFTEARHLARRIRELVMDGATELSRGGEQDGVSPSSSPQWSDVLVLVRSGSSFDYLETAFNEAKIPFLIKTGRGFWDALEISDLLVFLKCIEDPGDSLSLACLLRSPAGSFSDDDLVELGYAHTDALSSAQKMDRMPLYEGLQIKASSDAADGSLAERSAKFLRDFNSLFTVKARMPLRVLVEHWIELRSLELIWSYDPDKHLIFSNVRKFLRLCDKFAAEPITKLRAACDEFRTREIHEASAPASRDDSGAVEVMTVHAAKGLEAPIIALFDMNYQPKSHSSAFSFSKDSGAAFCVNQRSLKKGYYKPIRCAEIDQDKKNLSLSENERVLYVAMTRAREKLILAASGTKRDDEKVRVSGWFDLIMKHLHLDTEILFNMETPVSGPVPLIDIEGYDTGIELRRFHQSTSVEAEVGKGVTSKIDESTPVPASFPVKPEDKSAPVSVVSWLRGDPSVSEGSKKIEDDFEHARDRKVTGIKTGRLVHRVLEVLKRDMPENLWEDLIRSEARKLYGTDPDDEESGRVMTMMRHYSSSGLAARIDKSNRIRREFPILFELGETLFRGTLDLTFEEEDGWVLVDFKSDLRKPDSDVSLKERYFKQMQMYSLGWKSLTGKLPKEALLYYLQMDRIEPIPLDAHALRSVSELSIARGDT